MEKAIDGQTGEVIREGVIVIDSLRKHKIGKSEVFETLRKQGYTNLGEVRQAYLESSGRFSLFRAKTVRAGWPIEPAWDVCPPRMHGPKTQISENTSFACCNRGTLIEGQTKTPAACQHCGGTA